MGRVSRNGTVRRVAALAGAAVLIASAPACGSGDDTAHSVSTTAADRTSTAPPAERPADAAATPWERVDAPPDCMCSDGSPFAYFVHRADPHKVLFFLEGGGACFDAASCAPDSDRYTVKLSGDADRMAAAGTGDGLLDVADARNPLRDYSIVYVPYCTGDVHLGDSTTDYGNGVVIQHKGAVNSRAAIAAVKERFPDADHLVVAGVSAGSIPSPLAAGLLSDDFPEATITVVADGSGGYPNEPGLVSYVGGQWGTFKHVPDWPETTGMTPEQWNFAQLYVASHRHDPDIVFTRHDFAFDRTQISYAELAGFDASELDKAMDANEALIEQGGVDLLNFLQPGDDHTVLTRDRLFDERVGGVSYIEWLTAIIERSDLDGSAPADVHCTACAEGIDGK